MKNEIGIRPVRSESRAKFLGGVALVFCALWFCSIEAGAVGFRLPNQDPTGIARGNAFAATADNPSAIYYNPAGITQLEGHNISAGMYFISAGNSYTAPNGASTHADASFQPVPQLYYVYAPQDFPLAFGLGVYAPYGLAVDWGDNPPFATAAKNGSILYACINPVVAWRVTPELSLAIGPTINYSEAKFENSFLGFHGSDTDFGFNAGLRWQPCEFFAFGANYRYTTTLNYEGHSDPANFSSSAAITYPQFAVVGISIRPSTNWNFEFNIDWTDWNNVNELVFKNTAFGNLTFPFNFHDSFMYEFGVTRQLGGGYALSVGYIYSENSVPEFTFNPILPDANLHLGSVGLRHTGEHWDWAIGYHFGYNPGRTISSNNYFQLALGAPVAGTYRQFNNAINVSVTRKF